MHNAPERSGTVRWEIRHIRGKIVVQLKPEENLRGLNAQDNRGDVFFPYRPYPLTQNSGGNDNALPFYWVRSGGIGIGILNVVHATPIPPSQVVGGKVQPVPWPWHPAAQNMNPSMPFVVPAPLGGIVSTKLAAAF